MTSTTNAELLEAIKKRGRKRTEFGHGILTADLYVKSFQEVIGLRACYRLLSKSNGGEWASFDDVLRKAAKTLVYSNSEMEVEDRWEKKTSGNWNLPDEIVAPKNTLMVFKHVLTSSRKDRDGDILRTQGAKLDPKMLLLFNHIHTSPIGKFLGVAEHTGKVLKPYSAIVDVNELCHDCAVMIDNDMGRFSHGFRAIDFLEIKADRRDDTPGGYDVKTFEIMEESLVSVPANSDTCTEEVLLSLVEGGKMKSSLMREYGRGIREHRSLEVPVTIDLKAIVNGREVKDEDQSGDEAGRRGIEAGSPEEADEASTGKECEGAEDEKVAKQIEKKKAKVKIYLEGLIGSYEWIRERLEKEVKPFLASFGIEVGEHSWVSVEATFATNCLVSVCQGSGRRTHYEVQYVLSTDGKVTFQGEPKQVEVEVNTIAVGKSFIPPNGKPYPNEHALRLNDPDKYEKIRRQNDKFGEGIHAIFGVTSDGKTELQAIRFSADKFTVDEAKKWAEDHDYETSGFEPAKEEKKNIASEKAGRVLSKANEGKIKDAKGDVDEASGMEGVSRPCKALLRQASRSLGDVLNSLEGMPVGGAEGKTFVRAVKHAREKGTTVQLNVWTDGDEINVEEVDAGKGVKKAMALVLAKAGADDLALMKTRIEALEKRRASAIRASRFRELLGKDA